MFDYADFERHAKKYEHYKTARIRGHVFTENGEHDLEAGQFVAVRHIRNAWNGLTRRVEPVYSITANGSIWGVMYASNLSDFVL